MCRTQTYLVGGLVPLLLLGSAAVFSQQEGGSNNLRIADSTGVAATFTASKFIDTSNPFFQSLGTNGRACSTCHVPSVGYTISPPDIQARFDATQGLDPLFSPNDGANAPDLDMSTEDARRQNCSMLLNKGLIRVGIGIPANAEFTLVGVDDPYGYASEKELSLFRRPLPATNLGFLSAVMWDGRETIQKITGDPAASRQALLTDLAHQAMDATTGHAQAATPPTEAQLEQIVNFETGLYTAQVYDNDAGDLRVFGAQSGPVPLSNQGFYIGINDPLGGNPTGAAFNPVVFTLSDSWKQRKANDSSRWAARQAVLRGEAIFNTRQFAITRVGGLNDALGLKSITGTCTTCHDTPNVGNHSVSVPLNIGIADASRRTPDLPLYTLQNNMTGETAQTTDPGRALITGKWADIGKFKGPILRGLAIRAPYFHNGSAATLKDVVDFYNKRFHIGLTHQEQLDLIAFLRTL